MPISGSTTMPILSSSAVSKSSGRKRVKPGVDVRNSDKVVSGKTVVGRDRRPVVEDPVLTSQDSRRSAVDKIPLHLLLRAQTTYKSVPGSRRQIVSSERARLPLVCHHLDSTCENLTTLAPRPKPASHHASRPHAKYQQAPHPPPQQDKKGPGSKRKVSVSSKRCEPKDAGPQGPDVGAKTLANLGTGSLPVVIRQQWMVLPEFLSEELRDRHRYSLADIRKTLDAFPPRILWQLLISYDKSATNASSRVCSDHDQHMTFGGKPTAINKLLVVLKDLHPDWATRPSVTWNMHKRDDPNGDGQFYDVSDRHVPGLPVHRIQRATFENLFGNLVFWPSANIMNRSAAGAALTSARSIDKSLADNYFILTNNHNVGAKSPKGGKMQISVTTKIAKSIFVWRGIHVVALEINKTSDLLLMGRVIPWSNYVLAHGLPESLQTCPNFILAPDGYYALLDETFYFYSANDPLFAAQQATPVVAAASTQQIQGSDLIFKAPAPRPPRKTAGDTSHATKRARPALFNANENN